MYSFFFFPPFICISWRLITLQYCSGFCHTLTWISHGFTCVPHPVPPSHLPPNPIPLGHPSAPALSTCLMHPTCIYSLSMNQWEVQASALGIQRLERPLWGETWEVWLVKVSLSERRLNEKSRRERWVSGRAWDFGIRDTGIQIPALPLTCCVIQANLGFSEPQYHHV